jgi:uncharacterized membrane protein
MIALLLLAATGLWFIWRLVVVVLVLIAALAEEGRDA